MKTFLVLAVTVGCCMWIEYENKKEAKEKVEEIISGAVEEFKAGFQKYTKEQLEEKKQNMTIIFANITADYYILHEDKIVSGFKKFMMRAMLFSIWVSGMFVMIELCNFVAYVAMYVFGRRMYNDAINA